MRPAIPVTDNCDFLRLGISHIDDTDLLVLQKNHPIKPRTLGINPTGVVHPNAEILTLFEPSLRSLMAGFKSNGFTATDPALPSVPSQQAMSCGRILWDFPSKPIMITGLGAPNERVGFSWRFSLAWSISEADL